nr:cysteine endopeptidase Rep1-like isoform X2 [Lolium perenne]
MASMVSKLARAAFATRASPSAVGGLAGGGRRAAAISGSPADALTVSLAVPKAYPNPPVDENVLKSKEAMWAFYEHWCKFHGISRDRREMARRFKTFSDNARRVYEFNNSNCRGSLAMNPLSDATTEEIKMRNGYRRRTKK